MEVKEIPVRLIKPNPLQTRKNFDKEKLQELGESIKNHGLINPITVQTITDGYELITGERRLRAAKLVGVKSLQAIVKTVSPKQSSIETLIENVHREDLEYFERAEAIIHVFKANGIVLTQNISPREKDENKLKIIKSIGKTNYGVYHDLKGYFDLTPTERKKYKNLSRDIIIDVSGIKDKKTRELIIHKIKKDKIDYYPAREMIRAVKPLEKEDTDRIDFSKPVHEIKQQSEDIQTIRAIPKEKLKEKIKGFKVAVEGLKEAEKLEKEWIDERTPEDIKTGEAFEDWKRMVELKAAMQNAKCPECGGSSENLIWECCSIPALSGVSMAKEKFERLYEEAKKVEEENE